MNAERLSPMTSSNPRRAGSDLYQMVAQDVLKSLRDMDPNAKLSQAYDLIALTHGFKSWAEMAAKADDVQASLIPASPKRLDWQAMLKAATIPENEALTAPGYLCADIRGKMVPPSGDGRIWVNRAIQMLGGVLTVLLWQHGNIVTLAQIKEAITLDWIAGQIIRSSEIPPEIAEDLVDYTKCLAGFPGEIIGNLDLVDQKVEFTSQCRTQHGFLTQQLSTVWPRYRRDAVFNFT